MRCFWKVVATVFMATPAIADDCTIVRTDLFLPKAEVMFEKQSGASATLTLWDTTKAELIIFDLTPMNEASVEGTKVDMLLSQQTLVLGGITNQVTVTLQSKANSWLIGFSNNQTLRTTTGDVYEPSTLISGYLYCNQLRPWSLSQ